MSTLPRWIENSIRIHSTDPQSNTMCCSCAVRLDQNLSASDSLSTSIRRNCNFAFRPDQSRDNLTPIIEHLRDAHKITEPTICIGDAMNLLQKKMQFRSLMLELIPYLPFMLLFLNFVFWRYDFQSSRYAARGLSSMLSDQDLPPQAYQGADSVLSLTSGPLFKQTFTTQMNTVRDWHRWFETLYIPTFYDSSKPSAVPSLAGPVGQTLTVGAIRVRTFRVRSDSCEVNKYFYSDDYSNRRCYGEFSKAGIDEAPLIGSSVPFVSTSCGLQSKFADSIRGYIASEYPCGGHTVNFGRNLSFTDATNLAVSLRNGEFLSRDASRLVVVEGIVYSPPLDAFVLHKMITEISAGGSIITSVRVNPFYLLNSHFYGDGDRTSDIFLFFFVVFFWVRFFLDWIADRIRTGRLLAYLFDVWSIVEIAILTSTTSAIFLTWIQWSLAVSIRSGSILPDSSGQVFSDRLAYCAELYTLTSYFKSVAVVCVFLKFVKFFSVHNQFNILTRTLAAAAKSIVGVLIVFAFIVTAFALTGNLLYGPNIRIYSTLPRAFGTSFLALVGDFDYHSMYTKQKSLTFIYFWSYIVTGLFIMLNFITGIIGDKFDEESGRVRSASLGATFRQLVRFLKSLDFRLMWHRIRTREHRSVVTIVYTNMCVLVKAQTVPLSKRVNRAFFSEAIMSRNDAVVVTKERLDAVFDDLIDEQALVRKTEAEMEDEQLQQATEAGVASAIEKYFVSSTPSIANEADERAEMVINTGPELPAAVVSSFRSQPNTDVHEPDEFDELFQKIVSNRWSEDETETEIEKWAERRLRQSDACSLKGLSRRLKRINNALTTNSP
jgi:hypothetical protein